MQNDFSALSRMALVGITALLSACAGYSGSNLKPGIATLPEVVASMGEPAMRWKDPDGREQLAYPRGPAGTQTFMVFIGADGRLERIEAVLDMEHFARIEPGKSDQSSVLRLLGPSAPLRTQYYRLSNELAWEWRFCDGGSRLAFSMSCSTPAPACAHNLPAP
ncbi:MAG: hypothetical protein IPJ48_21155 [Propionivibrio sp.]|uniref:Lipoprotein n=1 Tax=Candidatus Propionivibrio dominans TaxID=2954373 RepID=A0A9D7FG81_9RHOO|nr:hypothetical protein [Candidatus Propionivibrio dominans]